MIFIKTLRLFIWNLVFDGDDTFKDLILLQHGNRHATVYKGTAFLVEIEDGFHHQELLFHRNTGVLLVKSVLLQEAQTDDSGDLQRQLLIIRKNIASDQLDDLHKRAFLVEDSHDLVSVINEFRGNMLSVPGSQVLQIFAVAGQPLDGREVTGIGKSLVQSPETADKTFGILCDRLGEITTLRGNCLPLQASPPDVRKAHGEPRPIGMWSLP